ncbi:MAG TPA: ATP-binding protein [Verrucomicrobiales bacterium]|nr:ATP-binding protein [Verrucomicrobiales bacterium]
MKTGFLDKLIARVGRVDPEEIQSSLGRLVREMGFLEKVFEALQEGVIVTDAGGTINYINRAACNFFGVEAESTVDHGIAGLIRGLDWQALTSAGEVVTRDLEIFYPENRFLQFYLAPMEDELAMGEQASRLGYVMIFHDITATRRQTERKIESEKLTSLTLLAAGVAHEIGNPLNSLNIHLQLIERKLRKRAPKVLASDVGELLQVARGEIARLDAIVTRFLHAVRPTRPRLEPTDVNRIIRDSMRFFDKELASRGIRVRLELHSHLPALLLDAGEIKQAFYNIIKNAMEAMPAEGELSVCSDLDDAEVTITFSDTGEGISAESMGRVFEPYYTTKPTGSGLGLLIVRRILREHGGEIEIQSRRSGGTRLVVHLPLEQRQIRFLPPETAAGAKAAPAPAEASS